MLSHGRVRLRRLRASDAPAIVGACGDPEVPRFIPLVPAPYTAADAEAFLESVERSWAETDERVFGITFAAADDLIGAVAVRLHEGGEAGYWVAREARGQGVATAALEAASGWAHAQGIERLRLMTHPANVASQRVAQKAGFLPIGAAGRLELPFRDGTAQAFLFERLRPADGVSQRLRRRVERDFGAASETVLRRLAALDLPLAEGQSRERIQAAVIAGAGGDMSTFATFVEVAEYDWRDVLAAAGLADADWPARLDEALGAF